MTDNLQVPTDSPFKADWTPPIFGTQESNIALEVFQNALNYQEHSDVEVFESIKTKESWSSQVGDTGALARIHSFLDAQPTEEGRLLAIFVKLKREPRTTFKYQCSISRPVLQALLSDAGLNPGFLPDLSGRSDYWAPNLLRQYSNNGKRAVTSIEYWCQHSRWRLNVCPAPCSVYMRFDKVQNKTFYLIAVGETDNITDSIRLDLQRFGGSQGSRPVDDPLRLHVRTAFLSFEQSKQPLMDVRGLLFEQLDEVDVYTHDQRSKDQLLVVTKKLHLVSQNADCLIGSADHAISIARKMAECCEIIRREASRKEPAPSYDHIRTVIVSIQYTRNWLQTYKSRKETAMNLVFNLVTQADSVTTLTISHDMKRDSASMKAIAFLTMTFLPATAVATVFGAGIFDEPEGLRVDLLIGYVVASLALTMFTLIVWRYGKQVKAFINFQGVRSIKFRNLALNSAKIPDEEATGTKVIEGKVSSDMTVTSSKNPKVQLDPSMMALRDRSTYGGMQIL